MDESIRPPRPARPGAGPRRGFYETALRVIGRYVDEQKPPRLFFFEQEGAFVVRLFLGGQAGSHHSLAEFTRDDIAQLVTQGPTLRIPTPGTEGDRLSGAPSRRPHPLHRRSNPSAQREPTEDPTMRLSRPSLSLSASRLPRSSSSRSSSWPGSSSG